MSDPIRRPIARRLRTLVAALAGGALLALSVGTSQPAAAQAKEPIHVGVIASLTGATALVGVPERDAILALAEQINAKGGVDGHPLKITVFDDQTNPTEAARGATQLIQQEKVVALIGPTTGTSALAMAPIAARYQVPHLAMVSTVPVISKNSAFYPWVFRTTVDEGILATALVQHLAKSGVKRIGLYYQEDAYGKYTAESVAKLAPDHNLQVVETVTSSMTATDLTAQASKLRNANPDAVVLMVTTPVLVSGFSRAAQQVGLKAKLWGGIPFNQKAYTDLLGKDGDGLRAMLLANFDAPTPSTKALGDILRAKGKVPNGFTEVAATNALMMLVKALEADPAATGPKLREALEKVCGLKTYSAGSACYSPDNHNGWGVDALIFAELRDGKFSTLK